MLFIDIVKIIGACAAIIGTCYTISNSKKSILRKIDRKEAQVHKINHELSSRYGLDRGPCHPITPLDEKKQKLENQIAELKRML